MIHNIKAVKRRRSNLCESFIIHLRKPKVYNTLQFSHSSAKINKRARTKEPQSNAKGAILA